jgi:hypothetical protein
MMRNPIQLHFPWVSSNTAKRARKRHVSRSSQAKSCTKRSLFAIPVADWPAPVGATVYFETSVGIQTGALQEIRQGLVWVDYITEDDRIVPESKLIMWPNPTPWRDPDTVSEEERKEWADRIRARLNAGVNLQQDPSAWEEFCHYVMFLLLEVRKRREEPCEIPPSTTVH